MITKKRLLIQIDQFPENIEIEDLIERLLFIDKIEDRLQRTKEGNIISDEEVNGEIAEWSK